MRYSKAPALCYLLLAAPRTREGSVCMESLSSMLSRAPRQIKSCGRPCLRLTQTVNLPPAWWGMYACWRLKLLTC